MHRVLAFVVVAATCAGAAAAPSAPAGADNDVVVPEALRPWVPWVLVGHEGQSCPSHEGGGGDVRACQWPGRLQVDANNAGASFSLKLRAYTAGAVPLPGSVERWPLDVLLDGRPAVVVAGPAGPAVAVGEGEHVVSGRFRWARLPESLHIPSDTGLVELSLSGKPVAVPDRDESGTLWLQRERQGDAPEAQEDRLDVTVMRRVDDGVPLTIDTFLLLEVSGRGREVVLPGALLAGTTGLRVEGPLPMRLEGQNLRVQVRPGVHAVHVVAHRADGQAPLTAPPAPAQLPPGTTWPLEEVWVFAANHSVRVVHVEGAAAIAAEQTRLPPEWRTLPAYRLTPGEGMTLVEERRGDDRSGPSRLSLTRTLWLDFDGKGLTTRDVLQGPFPGDRLEMGKETVLGHVTVSGRDELITTLPGAPPGAGQGVEVRAASLDVVADSRIERAGSFPAVSFQHDFQSVNLTLHLPPGYRLLHVQGVDSVNDTWLRAWTLFEIFLVLVLVAAIARLWGAALGGVSLLAFVLSFQERDAPMGLWVAVVVFAALSRVLPESLQARWPARLLRLLRLGTAVVLAMVFVGFAVEQIRFGMYPVLSQRYAAVGDGNDVQNVGGGFGMNGVGAGGGGQGELAEMAAVAPSAAPLEMDGSDSRSDDKPSSTDNVDTSAWNGRVLKKGKAMEQGYLKKAFLVDPNAVVQTGPGLPGWSFQAVRMGFTGPVKADQRIDLMLLPPALNLVLAFLRVLLLAVLVVAAFGFPGGFWPQRFVARFRGKGALFGALLLLGSTLAAAPAAAEVPPPEVLNELRERLLRAPACAPACADIARLSLEASPTRLRARYEIHAAALVAVPLFGADKQFEADLVVVDGAPAAALRREGGSLWVALAPGRHDVVVEGSLPQRAAVPLSLPMPPRFTTFSSGAWTLDGLDEDGVAQGNLQLSRLEQEQAGAADEGLEASVLPPFLKVERQITLGLTFEVTTRVERLSPTGAPVVVAIPLLPGESVTSDGVRVEGQAVQLNLSPQDQESSWRSTLSVRDALDLVAPVFAVGAPAAWVEVWRVEVGPVWHAKPSGIPPVHTDDSAVRTWQPWPGEKLSLLLSRPAPVAGQTLTIDRVNTRVTPGTRSTDVVMSLSLRSGKGGQHPIALPPQSELVSVSIAGRTQPLKAEERDGRPVVLLPIVPGAQQVELNVRVPAGVEVTTTSPAFDLGVGVVNAELVVDMPQDRWILFATGPRTGPAILFWSTLVVVLMASFALSRVPFSPLRAHHWVLLSLGLTQVPIPVAALVAGWLLFVGARGRFVELSPAWFNLRQLAFVGATVVALGVLVFAIQAGLLGQPDMQVSGNGSSGQHLRWFSDRATSTLPQGTVLSVPMLAYRLAMLAWSLWLALSLLRWLKVGWEAFGTGGYWRALPPPPPRAPRPAPGAPSLSNPLAAVPPGAPTSAAAMSTAAMSTAAATERSSDPKPEAPNDARPKPDAKPEG